MKKIKNITLKEYQTSKVGDFDTKDIIEMEKFNKISGTEIFEIKAKNCVRAKQYVGIVKINNKNISILPKIFGENNEKIIKNLLVMLNYTKKLNIKESDIANLGKTNNLFEIFIYIFAKELINLLRKDFKKNYNKISENSSFLKGKLLFAQHIKNNLFNKSKFFVEYEKMDENILLNIFFKSCSERFLKFTKSRENYKLLKKINFILQDIENYNFQNISSLAKIKFTKQNQIYKNIFSLAKMLYFGNSPDLSKNKSDNFSILFDMNVLFEEFITEFMKKNISQIDKNLISVNSQVSSKYVFEKKYSGKNYFNLKPDILLEYKKFKENFKKVIIDTKYKKLDSKKSNSGVNSADIYQMFLYGMRYFSKEKNTKVPLESKKIILLYPKYQEEIKKEYISEENIKILIKTIDLNFDLSNRKGREKLNIEIIKILK